MTKLLDTCQVCKGKGTVPFRDDDDAHGPIQCKACNGDGKVEGIKTLRAQLAAAEARAVKAEGQVRKLLEASDAN